MNDVAVLAQIVLVFAAAVIPLVVTVRLIAGPDTSYFGGMLQNLGNPPWPRGVQEEDPQPWNIAPKRI